MKEIKLICLKIENFKCFRYLELDFNGRNAEIRGDNASGKTSVFDAFMWALFSKSSNGDGDKNFDVKPLDKDGNVLDHNALTSVEVVLQVNGEKLTLQRTFREKWETRRGSSEAVFTGNTSEYYIDGVPVKRNGFQDKVNELVDEDTFRLLTNTSHVAAGISWQERREILFKVAGVMDDNQILATNEQFAPLAQSLGKLSLEDYKKKLLAEKRKFVGAKTEIPARISECQKTIEDVQGLDFAKARAEAEALQISLDSLSERIAQAEHNSAADNKRLEIREVQLEVKRLEAENQAHRDSQMSARADTYGMNMRLTALQTQVDRKNKSIQNDREFSAMLEKKIAASRERWISVNGDTFSGGTCPTCGQDLPEKQFRAAAERFEAGKKSRLSEIEKTANSYKESKAQADARIEEVQLEVMAMVREMEDLQKKIAEAEKAKANVQDMPDFEKKKQTLKDQIQRLSEELADMMLDTSTVVEKLGKEKREIMQMLSQQMAIVNKESLLEYSKERIEQLRQDAQNAAQCLDAIENMLYLMDEYSRYKTRFVEDSINGMFRIARFRLFREQANGGVEDRCDVVYEGVPYISVNNGMKINLGIDIINTLSAAYGVRVPLFVDNAESVTRLEHCDSQIIRLVVSENDKELRVNYEN